MKSHFELYRFSRPITKKVTLPLSEIHKLIVPDSYSIKMKFLTGIQEKSHVTDGRP